MKRKKLEMVLQSLEGPPSQSPHLEQYMTPASLAADILFFAHSMGDVEGKTVADLGAGTGIFSIGACLLGARRVFSVEIDEVMLSPLRRNAERFKCPLEVIEGDVSQFNVQVDTAIQNPPFGAQNRHADLPFLLKAMEVSRVFYSLHNATTLDFLKEKIEENGWRITHILTYDFPIPRIFHFHRKDVEFVEAVLIRAEHGLNM